MPRRATTTKIADRRREQAFRIKERLAGRGLTLADVDRHYRLPEGTARNTLREPNLQGERAIAAALGTRPEFLWRDRYHASGLRKSPQDYTRPVPLAQRRKELGALT